jgi:hypothetical protein
MHNLKVNVLKPLMRRLGSMAAGALVTYYGITSPETVQAIEAAALAVAMVIADLGHSYLNRRD